MSDPRTSPIDVVVVTYESGAHLEACLRALPAWCRVVVVDNASSDDSAVIAERGGARVVRNATNRGFAAAANQGVGLGTHDLVLLLNPDAVVDAAALGALVDAMEADERRAVVGPSLRRPDGSSQRAMWPFPTARAAWLEALGLLRLADRRPPGFVIGACFLTRRAVWSALGGFDERYWLYGEEADYCRRAVDAGYAVEVVPGAVARHIGGASGPALGEVTLEHFLRGTEHFVAKFEGPAEVRSLRRALLVGSVLRYPILRVRRPHDERTTYRRRVIARQWRVLGTHAEVVHTDADPIVVLSLEAWDDVWRRNQFLMRELLARDPNRRVLWVEPAHDVLHELRTRRRLRLRRRARRVAGYPQVVRLQPRKWLPRALGASADRSLARQVQRAARRLGMVRPTLWVNDPSYAVLVQRAGWPALYDMTDDWVLAAQDTERARIEANERVLFERCGAVVVCSPGLARSRGERRSVTLIPNAVDAEWFRAPQPRPADLPAGPVAVYCGTLHDMRIDVPLLVDLAVARPELSVVLIGPSALRPESTARLEALPNVHLLGARPHGSIPGYLQHADVLIVPHAVNEFTDSLDPIKAYELLAVERPVVATPVAGFRELATAFTVVDRSGFVAAVVAALGGTAARSTRPEPPTWASRAAAFDAALHEARSARPMRVAFLGHTARASGGELALARLLPALGGLDCHVVLAEPGPMVERYEQCGATVEVLAMSERARGVKKDTVAPRQLPMAALVDSARYMRALRNRLRALQPDVVHTNTLKAALYGAVAAKGAGVPVVWHVRDRISEDYLPPPAVWLVRRMAQLLPDAVISNSASTMSTLGHLRRVRRVVPSPVVFDSVTDPTLGRDPHRPVRAVGIVGRIAPWKGQDVFLRAFALAFAGEDDVRAVVVGAPLFGEVDFESSLHGLARELGVADRVDFRGFRDDIPTELAQIDLLVHASVIPEPFGQVVIEGMAAGVPVIASNEGGPAEVITDDVDGVLVPPGDPAVLAAALQRLARDAELRWRLSERAVFRARAFTPERVAVQVRQVYEEVLANR